MLKHYVSTPSRLCLFGEHQDYLGLEVVAVAINLRFSASIQKRDDKLIIIRIRDEKLSALGDENPNKLYQQYKIDLSSPIIYENNRDYLKSSVNILLKNGYEFDSGFDIVMDSTIPIGKGMCSSSTMIVALIKALLEGIGHPDKDKPETIALLAFHAEVTEFNEPGGMMDHYTSALGGLVHLKFPNGQTIARKLNASTSGCFILFDSLQQKNTTKVLADSKIPTLEALDTMKKFGICGLQDFIDNENNMEYISKLDDFHQRKLIANINNFKIIKEALLLFEQGSVPPEKLGGLIYEHHKNLRDGLNISTPTIEKIMDTALSNGGLGGKVNGSGGGGCLYVYAHTKDADKIIEKVKELGYPGQILSQDTGVRTDKIIKI